jgi:hypothetical protein
MEHIKKEGMILRVLNPSVPDNKIPVSFPNEPGNRASRDIILDSVTQYRLLACESHCSIKVGADPRRIL